MGKNTGLIKYIIKTPLKRPIPFFKYGGGFIALWAGFNTLKESPPTIETFIDAYIAYLSTKYLPPTTVIDIVLPIVVGATIAGLKWYMNT